MLILLLYSSATNSSGMVLVNEIPSTVFCVVFSCHCLFFRTMAKRAAETYLTDQNFDIEQPKEEVKNFVLLRD